MGKLTWDWCNSNGTAVDEPNVKETDGNRGIYSKYPGNSNITAVVLKVGGVWATTRRAVVILQTAVAVSSISSFFFLGGLPVPWDYCCLLAVSVSSQGRDRCRAEIRRSDASFLSSVPAWIFCLDVSFVAYSFNLLWLVCFNIFSVFPTTISSFGSFSIPSL